MNEYKNINEYKLVIIDGEGQTEWIKDEKIKGKRHIDYLLKFIKEDYPNNELLKRLSDEHILEIIGYFIILYNNLVFFNTAMNNEQNGKTGYFTFPPSLTSAQRSKLETLCASIPDYKIQIFYDLKIVDGFIEGEELFSKEPMSPLEILNLYDEKTKKGKTR